MLQPRILIVGAGAAGIAAASRLVENNINSLTILEAENRIGGRILTTEIEGAPIDLGAQWVHGEVNNVCHSLGSSAGLLSDDSYNITQSKCILSDGTFMKDDVAWRLYCLCKEILADEEALCKFKGSLGDYVNQRLLENQKSKIIDVEADELYCFLDWFHRFQNSIDGSDSWFKTSAQGTLQYHECDGNLLTRWKAGGYSNILHLLMKNNSDKVKEKIIFGKKVKSIQWNQSPLEVQCTDGQKFTADHVILTVSLGVLKENVSQLFLPPLPPLKIKAIQGLGIGTVNKIFLKFPHRWWPKDCTGFSLLKKNTHVPLNYEREMEWLNEVFGFYSVDSSPLLLCGWVVGPAARFMEQCSDQLVQDGCHQLLIQFLGKHYTIPPPDSILRSKWDSNPHFRGSYSFRSLDSDESGVTAAHLASPLCLTSGHPSVLFAGEATHDHYYSTVHGAIETGWREADRLISFYSKPLNRLPKASL